jgi:site-specific recombinase XerD
MTPTHNPLIAPLIQSFFTQHLQLHKRVSPQTVACYRDTFRLLFQFIKEQTGREPTTFRIADLAVEVILSFLDHLEERRRNSARSRNIRLAAIRTFFRWVALREPEQIDLATRVLAVPIKRTEKRIVQGLTREEMEALLNTPDPSTRQGRRDHALLSTLYNSGARISEVTGLRRNQVIFGASAFLQLHGKGRKERTVPLWPKTARTLQVWFRELGGDSQEFAFPSIRGARLTTEGANQILQRAVRKASIECPSLRDRHISPHTVRHATALHLLQSGVDISVIALWLGHESIETTHIYLEADLKTKERALEKLTPAGQAVRRYKAEDEVLAFLASL